MLDTYALLWLAQGGRELSEAALQGIEAAPVVYVSAISGFEIGIKVQKGKLELPARPHTGLRRSSNTTTSRYCRWF